MQYITDLLCLCVFLPPSKSNDSPIVFFSLFYWLRSEDDRGFSAMSCKAFLFSNCLCRCLCSLLGFFLIISEELTGTDHTGAPGQNQKWDNYTRQQQQHSGKIWEQHKKRWKKKGANTVELYKLCWFGFWYFTIINVILKNKIVVLNVSEDHCWTELCSLWLIWLSGCNLKASRAWHQSIELVK